MLVCFKLVCRAIGVLLGAWLFLVSFGTGYVACELNCQRVAQGLVVDKDREVELSERGYPILNGYDGPTMMWISFGGETVIDLEPKVSHILSLAGIAVFTAALGGGLIFLCLRRKKAS